MAAAAAALLHMDECMMNVCVGHRASGVNCQTTTIRRGNTVTTQTVCS